MTSPVADDKCVRISPQSRAASHASCPAATSHSSQSLTPIERRAGCIDHASPPRGRGRLHRLRLLQGAPAQQQRGHLQRPPSPTRLPEISHQLHRPHVLDRRVGDAHPETTRAVSRSRRRRGGVWSDEGARLRTRGCVYRWKTDCAGRHREPPRRRGTPLWPGADE